MRVTVTPKKPLRYKGKIVPANEPVLVDANVAEVWEKEGWLKPAAAARSAGSDADDKGGSK